MSKTLTVSEAAVLAEAGFKFAEINKEYDIVSSGSANVEAQAAQTPEVPVNEELLAAVQVLFEAARTPSRGRKTKSGRPRKILGTQDGIAPYAIQMSVHPDHA